MTVPLRFGLQKESGGGKLKYVGQAFKVGAMRAGGVPISRQRVWFTVVLLSVPGAVRSAGS